MVGLAIAVSVVVFTALSVLQILVAVGKPYGRLVWGGRHRVLPRGLRIGSALSPILYAAFLALMLSRAGVLPGSDSPVIGVASWILVAYFAIGTVLNGISRSEPERRTMTPVCLVLLAAAVTIATS